jgi:hypothetical protein
MKFALNNVGQKQECLKVLVLNLRTQTKYLDWDFSWLPAIPLSKCRSSSFESCIDIQELKGWLLNKASFTYFESYVAVCINP